MKTQTKIKLTDLKLNDGSYGLPKNPRFIKDDRFEKLCESVRDFPEAMPARGIVVDERGVILGGNMRFRACVKLKMQAIPAAWVHRLTGLTVEQKRRFIIMDNRSYGDDDFDLLANEWSIEELLASGCTDAILREAEQAEQSAIADAVQAEPEYIQDYDQAEKRIDAIIERLRKLQQQKPGALLRAKAIVLASGDNQVILIDDNLPEILTEIRRYCDAGEESPLASMINAVHKI